jgi:hypothetical protein
MLVGEWVDPLPLNSQGNTEACSEIQFISHSVFLSLFRWGGDDNNLKIGMPICSLSVMRPISKA